MRVANGFNPHTYQQQKPNSKHKGFADMLADMSANKSGKTGTEKDCGCKNDSTDIAILNMHISSFHRRHATQIKLTAEQLAPVEEYVGGTDKIGHLTAYEAEETPELIISKPFVADPKYPKSIWDILPSEIETEIGNANKACSYIDTEGLTKGEIYNRIEQIYKDYLGEDFETQWNLWSCALNGGGPGSRGYGFFLAESNFESQLIRFDVGRGNTEVVREARGYTGMTEAEMRSAVREKYPKNMTLKDCILMGQELWKLGLTDGNVGYCVQDYLQTSLGVNWNPPIYGPMSEADRKAFNSAFEKLYTAMLDIPADFEAIEALHNEYMEKGFTFVISEDVDDLFSKLISCFGGIELCSQEMLDTILEILKEMEAADRLVFDNIAS